MTTPLLSNSSHVTESYTEPSSDAGLAPFLSAFESVCMAYWEEFLF